MINLWLSYYYNLIDLTQFCLKSKLSDGLKPVSSLQKTNEKSSLRKIYAGPANMTIVRLDYVAACVPGKTRVCQRPVGTYLKMFLLGK